MSFRKRSKLIALLAALAFFGVAFTGCLGDGGDGGDGTDVTDGTDGADGADGGDGGEAQSTVDAVGTVKVGTLLPLTGPLEAFGPSMQKATELAALHINEAGGDVELVHEDSRTDSNQAPTAFNNLVNKGVVGVVGAASSGVTGSILDLAVDNEILVVTPASTSPALTGERNNQGYFWRVPPNDALQGKVLAQLLWDEGEQSVNVLAVNNPYGSGLAAQLEETYTELGGTVGQTIFFEEGGTTFTSQVQQAGEGDPDAIVFIGYPTEGGQVVREAYERGIIGDNRKIYFSEGVKDPAFVELVGKDEDGDWILAGTKGTTPQSIESAGAQVFIDAYKEEFGSEPGLFAAESYDAVWAIYLSALAAGEASGSVMKDEIREVWSSPGTSLTGAGDAEALLEAVATGEDVDYVGAANDFNWNEQGDPMSGVYAIWTVNEDGTITTLEEGIEVSLEE